MDDTISTAANAKQTQELLKYMARMRVKPPPKGSPAPLVPDRRLRGQSRQFNRSVQGMQQLQNNQDAKDQSLRQRQRALERASVRLELQKKQQINSLRNRVGALYEGLQEGLRKQLEKSWKIAQVCTEEAQQKNIVFPKLLSVLESLAKLESEIVIPLEQNRAYTLKKHNQNTLKDHRNGNVSEKVIAAVSQGPTLPSNAPSVPERTSTANNESVRVSFPNNLKDMATDIVYVGICQQCAEERKSATRKKAVRIWILLYDSKSKGFVTVHGALKGTITVTNLEVKDEDTIRHRITRKGAVGYRKDHLHVKTLVKQMKDQFGFYVRDMFGVW